MKKKPNCFTFVKNVVQANLLAALTKNNNALNQVYNVAVGEQTSLNQLFLILKQQLLEEGIKYDIPVKYSDFRKGDVRHSRASIEKITKNLDYNPEYSFKKGINATIKEYLKLK